MRTAVRDLATQQGITVDEKDMPFVLKLAGEEIPALKEAMASKKPENVRKAIADAGESLSGLVRSLPPRIAWEKSREERAKLFAFQSRLNEAKVQSAFMFSPHIGKSLADAWTALKDGARPAPGTEAFDAWFEKEVWTMLDGKLAAVKELRKANLPEGAAHDLMDKVLSGAVSTEVLRFGMANAAPIAGRLDASQLENALQAVAGGGQADGNALLQALNGVEKQMRNALPSKGFTPEEHALLRDMVRQAFMQQHGQLAGLMARIPAVQVTNLQQQAGPNSESLGLLHAGRGMVADAWLPAATADAIRTGTARPSMQQKLESTLRYGEPLFRQHSRSLPAHLHGMLRHLIGCQNYMTEQMRAESQAHVTRMVDVMAKWKSFSGDQSPKAICRRELETLNAMTLGNVGKHDEFVGTIFKSMIEDLPRSLYAINGTSFHHPTDPERGVLPALRQAVADEKMQRFLSALMHQGAWGDLLKVAEHQRDVPEALYRDKDAQKLANRSMNDFGFTLLTGGKDSVMQVELRVSPDGKTARLRFVRPFVLLPGGPDPGMDSFFGRAEMTQELTVSLDGEPRITGYALSQKLFDSPRGEL